MMSSISDQSVIADLHLHSPFSRAVSKYMTVPEMSYQAHRRGIDLLATGDWTHPQWIKQLEVDLVEWQPGIYASKEQPEGAKFLLSTEISCIFSQSGRVRRIHLLVFAPSLVVAKKINQALQERRVNLRADGRPIMGLSLIEVAELVFGIDEHCMIIPAHAWTPWFGLYGSKGGFDSLAEAFGTYADRIYAIETGLSSDPLMNWRVAELDNRAIVSFSDAHSPAKMGREVTVFRFKDNTVGRYAYSDICQAIAENFTGKNSGRLRLESTIEFYPEEGKYHWDGHRACGTVQSPEVTRERGVICPVCGKPLTVGVEHRVEELADREVRLKTTSLSSSVILKTNSDDDKRPGFISLVPLQEIIAEVKHKGVGTKGVIDAYNAILDQLGDEFKILLDVPIGEIATVAGEDIALAVEKVRKGELKIEPGYDGVYGTVSIDLESPVAQESLF